MSDILDTNLTSIATQQSNLLELILNADIIVQGTILLLFAASVWSWAIILEKSITLKTLKYKTAKFEKSFWSGQLLEQIYDRLKNNADNPLSLIFVAAMDEWTSKDAKNQVIAKDNHSRIGLKERIYQAMYIVKNREIEKLESRLVFLATVGSSATFVGLFGTVWGIMHSFQAIAETKNTSLSVVAPGIAEALLATAIGLVTALPAMIFYNLIAKQINRYEAKCFDFSSEIGNLLSRELDSGAR
jgi:biopolymer transport protein TolQ